MTNKEMRDKFYNIMMKKYNNYDDDEIIDMLTKEENELREELELRAMQEDKGII